MDNKVKILVGILAVLFVCLVVWVVRTTPTSAPPHEKFDPPRYVEYENNEISEERNGVKIWEINAEKITLDSLTQDAHLENVKGKFYNEDGRTLEVVGKEASYSQSTKNIVISGDVVATDSDGAKLTSGHLAWGDKDGILIAEENVKISKEDMRAYGDQAASTDGFKHFFLKGHARVLKGVKEDDAEENNSDGKNKKSETEKKSED